VMTCDVEEDLKNTKVMTCDVGFWPAFLHWEMGACRRGLGKHTGGHMKRWALTCFLTMWDKVMRKGAWIALDMDSSARGMGRSRRWDGVF
jgi:hypothetical protein